MRLQTWAVQIALGVLVAGAWAANPTSNRWNVLFVAVDDLRPELGCYGCRHIRSPNIDRLAARGRVFLRAYCQQAVCSPSRTSLLTGARPDTTRIYDLETHFRTTMGDRVVTLPQLFKQHGWFVQGMGKIYHSGLDDPVSWSVPWSSPKTPTYALPENRAIVERKVAETRARLAQGLKPTRARDYGPPVECADVPDPTYYDGALATMAIDALRGAAARQPFWLGVGFIRPHLPFVAPKKYWDLYDRAQIQLAPNPFPPRGAPPYAVPEGGELRSYEGVPRGPLPEELARTLRHGYYAAVSYMDAQLGRVLDELDRLGLTDRTIVVLWGDHGWKLGEHGAWCKHTNVELDTRAPLIVVVPGMPQPGRPTEGIVEFVDIYPTLAELCGLPTPSHLEGTSFRPLLDNPDQPWKRAAFSQYPRTHQGRSLMGYSMRTERYRFTMWQDAKQPDRVDAIELYDHQQDPQENENLADRPEMAEVVRELTAMLRAGWKAAGPPASSR
jgi:arylsulfatase A-like enzyme